MGSTDGCEDTGNVGVVSASCSRPGCSRVPAATLVYDYAGRVVVLDALAPSHPMQYDLCATHADRLSVPNGWTLIDRRPAAPVTDLHQLRAS